MASILERPVLLTVPALAAAIACGAKGPGSGSASAGGASASSTNGAGASGSSQTTPGSAGASGTMGVGEGGPVDGGGSTALDGEGGAPSACGAGDTKLPPQPTIPPPCTTLTASQFVSPGQLPSETNLDTQTIQAALDACGTGLSVRLAMGAAADGDAGGEADEGNNAFVSGPLNLPDGVTLWIDSGVTLFATRDAAAYGSTCSTDGGTCAPLISSTAANTGVVGAGVIDGQGGEPILNQAQSWWDLTGSTNGDSANPALIQTDAAKNFTLYGITLHNSPKFHVKLDAAGFVVWGVTIKTPSRPTNSQGESLTPAGAHNTDGIDPGESASDGFIVCSTISDGDDQIAIKGGTSVENLTIAHNHFGSGHGMSIGSETNGGVADIDVYDLSIDGADSGLSGGSSNGIRIKSDPSVGGLVTNVTYTDVCVRDLTNPIVLTPHYTSATGNSIPDYTGITIRDFRSVASSVAPSVTIDGFDTAHLTQLTLDNVVIDGIEGSNVTATDANITLGPGAVNFTPSGTDVTVTNSVSGASEPNACDGKFVSL